MRVRGIAGLIVLLAARTASADGDNLDLRVYGDVNYLYKAPVHPVAGTSLVHHSFSAAQLDLFPTYSTDRLSFLAEVVLEGDTQTNQFGIDVERVQVSYLVADWLRFKAGRSHTGFGYYNDAFHHGKYFELTTGRPWLANFEDGGGLLLAHVVGVGIDGKIPLGGGNDFHYDFEVGNGRDTNLGSVSLAEARKDAKYFNLRLRVMPKFLDGLILGVNGSTDIAPGSAKDATTGTQPDGTIPNDLREWAAGAHIAYLEHDFHVILEGASITHVEQATSTTYQNWGGFAELGYSIDDWTPYVRYEHLKLDERGDPLYQAGKLRNAGNVNDLKFGMRWRATDNIAAKLEWRWVGTDTGADLASYSAIQAQMAFGF